MHAPRSFSRTILHPARILKYQCTDIDPGKRWCIPQSGLEKTCSFAANLSGPFDMDVIEENWNRDIVLQFILTGFA